MTQATGSIVEISGRNDGDTAYHYVVSFSWAFDDAPLGGARSPGRQRLPGGQVNRVAFISGPYRSTRFVSLPTMNCGAAE